MTPARQPSRDVETLPCIEVRTLFVPVSLCHAVFRVSANLEIEIIQ